jgi:hypothetical protein
MKGGAEERMRGRDVCLGKAFARKELGEQQELQHNQGDSKAGVRTLGETNGPETIGRAILSNHYLSSQLKSCDFTLRTMVSQKRF